MAQKPFLDVTLGPLIYDLAGTPGKPGYLVDAQGVRQTSVGLKPIPLFANTFGTTAVTGTVHGRLFATETAGTVHVFACTGTVGPSDAGIYQSNDLGVTWNDNEGTSGAPGLWADFCQFDEFIICGSRARAPQEKSVFDAVGTNFGDLAGSPPTGATLARVRDHVVIGNLTTDDLSKYAVRGSAIGDPETWPTLGTADARSKEAFIQYLPLDLGQVTKVVGGEKFGLIFQQRGITRMTYVGGATVFEFDTFEKKIGTGYVENDSIDNVLIPHPVLQVGPLFMWVNAASGVYATDGYSIRKISGGKFDSLFSGGSSTRFAAYDDAKDLAFLFYGGLGGTSCFGYSPSLDEFTYIADSGIRTLCELPVATTGARIVANLSSAFVLQTQSSGTMESAVLQTGYIEVDPGYYVELHGAYLLGKGTPGNLTVSFKAVSDYEDIDAATTSFTNLTEQTIGKKLTGRAKGRFFAFRITGVPTSTQIIQGLRIFFTRGEPA